MKTLQLVNETGAPLTIDQVHMKSDIGKLSEAEKLNFIIDCWPKERQANALKTILKVAELLLKQADDSKMTKQMKEDTADSLIMIRSMRLGLMEADRVGHQ